jgi:hypothetical protein
MNKWNILFVGIFSCLSCGLIAQDKKWSPAPSYFDNIRHREIMMNLTPLVAQFVPFNASTASKLNIFDFETRRLKNGKGTHFGLGVNIDASFNPTEPNSIYLRYGFAKRRQITERFHFTRYWDINLVAEDFEGTNVQRGKLDFSGFAISYSAAIEYSFNDRLALSTQGILFFGLLNMNTGEPKIKFIPPVGLFLHVKI